MTNPNQLLCNVLEECGLSNTADVAAKLIVRRKTSLLNSTLGSLLNWMQLQSAT